MSLPPDLLVRAIQDDRLREAAQRRQQWSAQLPRRFRVTRARFRTDLVFAALTARSRRHAAEAALGNEVRPQTTAVRGQDAPLRGAG
jgi:hypothetical protein